MNIFKSDDSRKTAKEHIMQKRNLNLYLDLKNNDKLNHTACLNDKKIKKIKNHSSLINLSHGFYDYFQNGKCRDICNNYLSTDSINMEVFRNKPQYCSEKNDGNNNDISNNYSGMILTHITDADYPNSSVLNSKEANKIMYSHVEEIANPTLKAKKILKKTKCFGLNSNNIIIE